MSIIYKFILVLGDILFIHLSFIATLLLLFDFTIPPHYLDAYLEQVVILTFIHVFCNVLMNLYHALLRYITTREVLHTAAATVGASTFFYLRGYFTQTTFPASVYIVHCCLLLLCMLFSRFVYKLMHRILSNASGPYRNFKNYMNGIRKHRVLLIGAGDAASLLVHENIKQLDSEFKYVVALDDMKTKYFSNLHGIPIRGPIQYVEKFVTLYDIDTIVIAMPSAGHKRIAEIITLCSSLDCTIRLFSGISTSASTDAPRYETRQVKVEDLLGRDEVFIDSEKIAADIHAHTVLVTGGGGSIGSELCRQISHFQPKRILIFDIYENNAYDIQNELLLSGFSADKLITIIGSVRDEDKLEQVFRLYKPSIVFHAAAHKHVPLMENNPSDAIKNNIFGTFNVAMAACRHQTKKFILISTDKAVNPTNVMGATKRFCEILIQAINQTTSTTDYVAVRFGNVLGSNGSVIPLFKRQLDNGGPLTVTHPDIIRYFMTIPEAVRLILEAMSFATGGEIFVLDMGQPVKILDLAENFIKLSGLEPYEDIDIVFSGLRPGEKLYEELLMSEEGLGSTHSKKIFIGKPSEYTFEDVMLGLDALSYAMQHHLDIREVLMRIVPTYHPTDKVTPITPNRTPDTLNAPTVLVKSNAC